LWVGTFSFFSSRIGAEGVTFADKPKATLSFPADAATCLKKKEY
jgi:hypothetical protein